MAMRFIYNIKVSQRYPLLLQYGIIKSKLDLQNLLTIKVRKLYSINIHNQNGSSKKNIYNNYLSVKTNQSVITSLSNILNVDEHEILQICEDIKKYEELKIVEIINMITIVNKAGLSISTIVENLPTLIRNIDTLKKKISCLKTLDENINDMIPLLNLNMKDLNELLFIGEEKYDGVKINKLKYIADELECSLYILCEYILNNPWILKFTIRKIKTVINILKEFDYELKDILFNLWIFKYNPRTIYRKSSIMKAAGMNKIKPWIVRSSIDGLRECIKRLKKQEILAAIYGNHIDFLSMKLNLSEEEVKFYINRSPELLNLQIKKIDEVINVLHKYGYSAQDILLCPRIFLLKTKLLEERLEVLQHLRGQHRLSLVYCSSKLFKTMCLNLKS